MKHALLLPVRYLILLCIFLAIMALCSFGLAKAGGQEFNQAVTTGVAETVSNFPVLCLCALFVSSFAPLRRKCNMPLAFALLFASAFASLSFGTLGLDSVFSASKAALPKTISLPRAGFVVRAEGNAAYYAESIADKGKTARNAVIADFSALPAKGTGTILSFHAKRDLPVGGQAQSPKIHTETSGKPAFISSLESQAKAIRAFARSGKGLITDLISAAVLALAFTSLWLFTRLPSWKLTGVFLGLAAFSGSLWLVRAVSSEEFRRLMTGLTNAKIAAWSAHGVFVLIAALLVLWDVLLSKARARGGRDEE